MVDFPPTFVDGFHDEKKIRKMKYNKLGPTDLMVSRLSLGSGGFSHFYGDYSLEECRLLVRESLESGINYIDTGPWYGHGTAEKILGQCLRDIPRQAYYIGSKVGRYEADPKFMFDFSAEKTRESVKKSLETLGVGYIDVMQVHDCEFASSLDIILNETLPTLQEFVNEGKIRFIGITGYPNSILKEVIERSRVKISTVLSYTRLTMIDRSLNEFIPFYKTHDIGIINASVHAMGLLTNGGPQIWHPASDYLKKICLEAGNFCKENGVELGKLALHFALLQNGPDTILTGVNTRALFEINLDVVQNGLSEKELQVYEEVMIRFFSALEETHWEGVELKKFAEDSYSAFL
ncbi:L-galactose dehydrogenase-like [Coccinella septempunctata]|uniref:L-galactose dehydrogenase-like n=1 Tax=Coccinella septempunctata TaxID=41139 RepID=UPI001D061711|nr:L-galactose dehydrogenase-like [Coccinella septempunctata]